MDFCGSGFLRTPLLPKFNTCIHPFYFFDFLCPFSNPIHFFRWPHPSLFLLSLQSSPCKHHRSWPFCIVRPQPWIKFLPAKLPRPSFIQFLQNVVGFATPFLSMLFGFLFCGAYFSSFSSCSHFPPHHVSKHLLWFLSSFYKWMSHLFLSSNGRAIFLSLKAGAINYLLHEFSPKVPCYGISFD